MIREITTESFTESATQTRELGGLGYAVRTTISDQEAFEWSDMFIDAGISAFSSMFSFGGSMIGGMVNIKIPGTKSSFRDFALYHAASAYFGLYTVKFIFSHIKQILKEKY